MKLLRLAPENTKFPFMRFRRVSYPFSAALSIISVVLFLTLGMNFGIDFSGGTLMELRAKSGTADISAIRSEMRKLTSGDIEVQGFGSPSDVLLRFGVPKEGATAQEQTVSAVKNALSSQYDFRRVEVVGPRVSGELVQSGTLGVVISIVAVLCYLWFRFEWQFAVGAIIATMHDLLLTVGFFSITRLEFNTTSIAAILTIVGYSLNETVVVLDRIREMMKKYRKMPTDQLIDVLGQRGPAAHDHDGDDGLPGAAVARHLRRRSHPLVLAGDDLGHLRRDLFLGLHLLANADLSRPAQHQRRVCPGARGEGCEGQKNGRGEDGVVRPVIASQAERSGRVDCFVAFAPRNDEASMRARCPAKNIPAFFPANMSSRAMAATASVSAACRIAARFSRCPPASMPGM